MTGFLDIVAERADVSTPEAEDTAEAVLKTLSEGISHGEAADLAAPLPEPYARVLRETERGRAEPPAFEEFVSRVGDRLDVSEHEAEARSQAVVAALSETVGVEEVEDARSQLPPEYEEVFEPGEALGSESFVEAVADHGDLSRAHARRASEVVLATLGERLSKGEAEDVAEYLPEDAAEWLVPDEPARALDYDFDELVAEVADQENVTRELAIEHAEAVTDVLADAVGEEELDRMQAQLPETYDPMFA
ncbi:MULTISPECIES: DUF2267 domain-containing protein [unclassified Halobacterium]|jgi:uncharacterized protein (DUF2267 family)|uniref:DUF2267 domain-containing protein n=1 Tax=unclassified Halobacterium TaxID=2668073 RepID=UPI001E4EB832|nr:MULTISPECIES: DUF2267 domain-containing protein [unclassified Halobacterium]MCD2199474.1 DUF2267 domain-containing protein [Halobacterium sp. KA-4]MCD2204437.1 DUF2267 domain-containing protein [Halobacterium sp. KA-6]